MKRTFPLTVLSIFSIVSALVFFNTFELAAQSGKTIIIFDDGSCIDPLPGTTLQYLASSGNPTRHSYRENIANGGIPLTVQWSSGNNRWEVVINDLGCSQSYVLFYSNFRSAPNPPSFGVGAWTALPVTDCFGNMFTCSLLGISGSGTQDNCGTGCPAVNLYVSTTAGTEAAATMITVTAAAAAPVPGDQMVSLAVTGTGITTGDYTLGSSTISIPNGSTAGTVMFTVIDDASIEGTEIATLTISNPSSGIILGSTIMQSITIQDNDMAASCPTFSGAPANVSITNSTCSDGCALSGGTITAPSGTPCPTGSTLQYQVNGGAWTSTLPTYAQSGSAQSIKTRCQCNSTPATVSAESAAVVTVPGSCPTPGLSQLGNDIDGENDFDGSGYAVAISADGSTVAVGAPGNAGDGGFQRGHVRVYQWNGTNWIQQGADIDGAVDSESSGYSVALSADGSTLALSAYNADGGGIARGEVRIYQFSGGSWNLKGSAIAGEADNDKSGWSIAMSPDGNTIAIGAPFNAGNGGFERGQVRVYEFSGGDWIQRGDDLDGVADMDQVGWSVAISTDGNTVAMGSPNASGGGTARGEIRVYQYSGGSWTLKGTAINGAMDNYQTGGSISLSGDGNTIAVGEIGNPGGGDTRGSVRVLGYTGSSWAQIGSNINGEADFDSFGYSVSLSADGLTLAVGALGNAGDGGFFRGHTRVFKLANGSWTQQLNDLDGEADSDQSGGSVALSADGSRVVIGALGNAGGGDGRGHARVYDYTCATCPTFSGAPANVSITNSTCASACTLSGGDITAPSGTPCPTGSTLEYQVDGGAWSTTLPVYDQDGPAQSIKTRCKCDLDANMTSAESTAAVTVPGSCVTPTLTGPSSVAVNAMITLTGSGTPAGSMPYTSNNTGVATVNSSGVVTGVSDGMATITYTNVSGCTTTKVVTVTPVCPTFSGAPANVSITNSTCASACTLSGGLITAPTGTPCPTGSTLEYQVDGGAWSTTLPVYDQDGPAQSIKTRCKCDLDANMTSAESTAAVTVPGTCETPTLTGPSSVGVGAMITLTGSGTPAGSMPYTSNNTGVATVNSSGVVTGVSDGMATITYTNASGCTTTKVVTVTPVCPTFSGAPANVSITNSTCASACTLSGGLITAPTGTPCPTGSTLEYQVDGGAWSTTLPVYDQDGPAQSIKTRCKCDIDANMTSAESTAAVTVPGTCETPTLTGPSSVGVGAMITLTGSGTPAGSMPYTSNNTGVATVNSSGVVTGVSDGMATITYTNASGCTTTKVVTVTPVCPTFSGAPANVTITNSTCASACTLSGGLITAPSGTPCPTGSTLEYQVDGGAWSTTLPVYDQDGPAQSIKTRCKCDIDANMTSAESVAAVTIPGTLANPVVPANGSLTVACLSAATTPTPPAVTGCDGSAITPTGPVTTDSPNPVTCEGTRTYTYTYTCGSTSSTWSFVYTIERNTFTVPANGAATVACLAAATPPTAPTVTSNCGEPLTPTGPVTTDSPNPLTCEGTRTYAYTYTDCEGNTAVWSFVYTIERDPFTVPANGAATVACLSDITVPVPPAVNSNCGEPIAPAFVSIVDGPSPLTCEGTRSYNYSYTDCEGNTLPWSFVYTIERNTFTVPANGAATVACPANATAPTPPAVLSACGETLTPTGPVTTNVPNPLTCEGTRTYAYTYTDCEGNTAVWSFVYTIERNTFTVPANGAATVACLAAATPPTAPAVTSNCGEPLTPTGPVTTDSPNPLTCEGTRTYAYTYTDCEGNTAVWSFVYTIERDPFTVPANGAATVACLSDITVPVPPAVNSNCGEPIAPAFVSIVDGPSPLTCEGTRSYNYSYTDCEGNTLPWSFVYTIERNTFTVPANGASTVACPANATAPTPPAVLSACGETLTPTGPVTTNVPNPLTCEGTRTYAYTYTDCEGNTAVWSFVYTIERNTFTVPANGAATVACLAAATAPTAPAVTSDCGEPLTPTGPVVTDSPNPLTCEGTRTYAYTYTDCEGNTAVWSFVYTIERNPFTVPANGAATVNSPGLATAPALPTVTSNCGEVLAPTGPVITNSPNPLVCAGTRTYAYTYTDCEGNTATWSFVYTVIDNTPPTISCSNATVTFSGEATLALNVSNLASASDNCGAPTVTLSTNTVACAQVGQTVMVTATATDGAGLTANCVSQVTVAGLPCGWSQDSDGIGCGGGNNVGFTSGVFTINSTNCYSVAPYDTDEAGFAQQQLCGNGSIVARVTSINGSGWAGVALRESDAPGARKAQLLTNLSSFSRREVRYTTGGQAYPQQFPSQAKYWLRILRMGDQFVGYVSANGSSWSQVFAVTITGLPSCIQAGLVVTNQQANSLVTATFSNVSITSMPTLSAIETEELGTEVVDLHLNIFPNPTSGEVTVDFTPWAGKPALLEVYDLQGRRVRRLELDEATGPMPVDMSNLPGGVYLFRVGEVQQRVVLQRP